MVSAAQLSQNVTKQKHRKGLMYLARKNLNGIIFNILCGMKARVRMVGAQVELSSCRLQVQNHSFREWAAAKCSALPTAKADHYAISHCKPLLLLINSGI